MFGRLSACHILNEVLSITAQELTVEQSYRPVVDPQ